jgi:RNA-directed DNA polymerase
MGLVRWIKKRFGGGALPPIADAAHAARDEAGPRGVAALAKWLGMTEGELRTVPITYTRFKVPKRSGGTRTLAAPNPQLKAVQRRLLRRVLRKLAAHPAATGFERGHSILSNAKHHERRVVVVRIDLKDFFPSVRADRVNAYFRGIGWTAAAADLLTRLCTLDGGLPQGAPTSPRLSNLVNWELDARLQALSDALGARYTRYADDLTFSFDKDDRKTVHQLVGAVGVIVENCGYRMHMKKKLRIRRRHQRQLVTGLVVNEGARLPRQTRRWLRAVEHRVRTGGQATLTTTELAGWRALVRMVEGGGASDGGVLRSGQG